MAADIQEAFLRLRTRGEADRPERGSLLMWLLTGWRLAWLLLTRKQS